MHTPLEQDIGMLHSVSLFFLPYRFPDYFVCVSLANSIYCDIDALFEYWKYVTIDFLCVCIIWNRCTSNSMGWLSRLLYSWQVTAGYTTTTAKSVTLFERNVIWWVFQIAPEVYFWPFRLKYRKYFLLCCNTCAIERKASLSDTAFSSPSNKV